VLPKVQERKTSQVEIAFQWASVAHCGSGRWDLRQREKTQVLLNTTFNFFLKLLYLSSQ
jgi:hypothetical protein